METFTYCTVGRIKYVDFENILIHNKDIKNDIITKVLANPYDVDRNFFVLLAK